MMTIQTLTDANYLQPLQTEHRGILLRFGAPSCLPCKAFNPHLMALATELKILEFYGCNAEQNPQAVAYYQIHSIPTFLFIYQKQVIATYHGALIKEELRNWLLQQLENALVQESCGYLQQGQVIAFPTETVYALSADATNDKAVAEIYRLKQRSVQKPCSIFILPQMLSSLVTYPSTFEEFIQQELAKGNTVVLPKLAPTILPALYNDNLGIRLPQHHFSQQLVAKMQVPLIATSVNLSGQQPVNHAQEIHQLFPQLDYIVDAEWLTDPLPCGQPSQVFSLVNNKIEVLRQ